jgi:hypothetical protein
MIKSILILVLILAFAAGCHRNGEPRLRGSYFGGVIGDYFLDPNNLGKHQYGNSLTEQNGFVYTSKGGFIDIGHVRESADRTAYISRIIYDNLMKNGNEFSFQIIEPSRYFVKIKYPDNWKELPDKEDIAKEISISLGQYFAQKTTIWHEIITWFGFKSSGIFSEYVSSFSWEDDYSDLIGTYVAVQALNDNQHEYDDAVAIYINEELKILGVQPSRTARLANHEIYGKWYTGGVYFFTVLQKRKIDSNMDGFIIPWLVPGICPDSEPQSYPVPNLDILCKYGFSIEYEIEPKIFEQDAILKIIYPNGECKRIKPIVDFPVIMEYIKNDAVKKYGANVSVPNLQ